MYDKELIPNHWKSNIPEECKNNAWKLFAENITRNRWVKQYLLNRAEGKCDWCNKGFVNADEGIVHHKTYSSFCLCPDSCMEIYDPSLNNANRTIVIPNCGECQYKEKCLDQLALVHSNCNKEINDIQLGKKENVYKEEHNNYFRQSAISYNNTINRINEILESPNALELLENEFTAFFIQLYHVENSVQYFLKIWDLCKEEYTQRVEDILFEWRGYKGFSDQIKVKCPILKKAFVGSLNNIIVGTLFNVVPVHDEINHPRRKRYVKEEEIDDYLFNHKDACIVKNFKKSTLDAVFGRR